MSLYPDKIQQRLASLGSAGPLDDENAGATDASFLCGSFVRFSIRIDPSKRCVTAAGFQTNGCGYMTAAADCLAAGVSGRPLSELHGLDEAGLNSVIDKGIGRFGPGRAHCRESAIRALQMAFADYRTRQIEEFRGEKALICTCFGVTEETIEMQIHKRDLKTVEEVTGVCRAGGGCGSCRMLIQEMLDGQKRLEAPL